MKYENLCTGCYNCKNKQLNQYKDEPCKSCECGSKWEEEILISS